MTSSTSVHLSFPGLVAAPLPLLLSAGLLLSASAVQAAEAGVLPACQPSQLQPTTNQSALGRALATSPCGPGCPSRSAVVQGEPACTYDPPRPVAPQTIRGLW